MALILNIETSTEVCSVTLAENGKTLLKKESTEGMNHSRLLTVFINGIFAEYKEAIKSLNAVAVSKGPGSYTGLRIGVSVAKGLCYGLNIPMISVNSLESLGKHTAYVDQSGEETLFCPMIDARRMEVYTALYDKSGKELKPVTAEIITGDFLSEYLENYNILFFGNGASKCKQVLTHGNAIFKGPQTTSAEYMQSIAEEKFRLNKFENVAYFEPFYLKNFIATIPKNKVLQ